MTTPEQRASRKQEERLAERLGGTRVPGSGSSWSHKGDVSTDDLLVEHKYTSRNSFSVRSDVWRKIEKEAVLTGKTPVLAIRMDVSDLDLVVMSEDDFIQMRESVNGAD